MEIKLDFNQIEKITIYYSQLGGTETYFFSQEQAIKWTKEEMKKRKIRGKAERFIMEESIYPSQVKQVIFQLTDDGAEDESYIVKNS